MNQVAIDALENAVRGAFESADTFAIEEIIHEPNLSFASVRELSLA